MQTSLRFCTQPLEFDVEISRKATKDRSKIIPGQVVGAGMTIQKFLLQHSPENHTKVERGVTLHGHWANAVIGVYVGSDIDKVGFANGVLEYFILGMQEYGIGSTFQTQFCGGNSNASSIFGIIADTSSGVEALSTVQKAVKAWSKGECAESLEAVSSKARPPLSTGRVLNNSFQGFNQASNWVRQSGQRTNDTSRVDMMELLPKSRLA